MIENLTSLGITPNEVDSDVGEDSEEDEELRHRDDCKRELGDVDATPKFFYTRNMFI